MYCEKRNDLSYSLLSDCPSVHAHHRFDSEENSLHWDQQRFAVIKERRQSSGKPPDDSATDTDSDGERIRSRKSERVQKALAQRKGDAQKLAKNSVGYLQPSKRKTSSGHTFLLCSFALPCQ